MFRIFALCLAFLLFSVSYAKSVSINQIIIRIEIDQLKRGDSKWDTANPFGPEPDPHGTISINGETKKIALQNNYTVDVVFRNVNLDPGDSITINLVDRDRGRWDDDICKGVVRWDGQPQMIVKHGSATVKIDFLM